MVNMLSRERKPTTEDLQGRPRDGHGPDGHVNSQATQAALQFEGIPRRHDEDALPDPDDAGTVNEPLLLVRPPLSSFRYPLPPKDDLTDPCRRGPIKLSQIDRRVRLFREGDVVVDLGASPGGCPKWPGSGSARPAACSRWTSPRSFRWKASSSSAATSKTPRCRRSSSIAFADPPTSSSATCPPSSAGIAPWTSPAPSIWRRRPSPSACGRFDREGACWSRSFRGTATGSSSAACPRDSRPRKGSSRAPPRRAAPSCTSSRSAGSRL